MEALEAASQLHPDKTIRLYVQDEARVGQKCRLCHRWWPKGQRATGLCDRRFRSTYTFGAVAPETGDALPIGIGIDKRLLRKGKDRSRHSDIWLSAERFLRQADLLIELGDAVGTLLGGRLLMLADSPSQASPIGS